MSLVERRQTRIAVVLAVVFLAVLGAGAGIALGAQQPGDDTAGPQVTVTPSTSESARSPDPVASESTGQPAPSRSTATSKPPKGYGTPTRDTCPGQLVDAARKAGAHGELSIQIYVKTNSSEVWICRDSKHKLFYQGHLLGKPFPSGSSDTTKFITDVEGRDHGLFVATSGETVYNVSSRGIVIEHADGTSSEQEAVDCYTP